MIALLTIDQLRYDRSGAKPCRDADLVLTFVHREAEMQGLVPDANILALRFIPSVRTRQALALLDPRTRVAAVTHFKDYIAIMRPSVREFAPHVSDITVDVVLGAGPAPRSSRAATWSSTRPEPITSPSLAGPSKHCFEYRHAPDPGVLENLLAPALADLRRGKIAEDCEARRGRRSGPAHRARTHESP